MQIIIYFSLIALVSICYLTIIWYYSISEWFSWKEKTDLIIAICLTIPILIINILMFLYLFG